MSDLSCVLICNPDRMFNLLYQKCREKMADSCREKNKSLRIKSIISYFFDLSLSSLRASVHRCIVRFNTVQSLESDRSIFEGNIVTFLSSYLNEVHRNTSYAYTFCKYLYDIVKFQNYHLSKKKKKKERIVTKLKNSHIYIFFFF